MKAHLYGPLPDAAWPWLVTVRRGDVVETYRFTSRDDADEFLTDGAVIPAQEASNVQATALLELLDKEMGK